MDFEIDFSGFFRDRARAKAQLEQALAALKSRYERLSETEQVGIRGAIENLLGQAQILSKMGIGGTACFFIEPSAYSEPEETDEWLYHVVPPRILLRAIECWDQHDGCEVDVDGLVDELLLQPKPQW